MLTIAEIKKMVRQKPEIIKYLPRYHQRVLEALLKEGKRRQQGVEYPLPSRTKRAN